MIALSRRTAELVARLFDPGDAPEATRLLETDCAERLPLIHSPNPQGLERIRFAALRASGGSLSKLRSMVEMAQIDWRDLLMTAGFAESTEAHNIWAESLLSDK